MKSCFLQRCNNCLVHGWVHEILAGEIREIRALQDGRVWHLNQRKLYRIKILETLQNLFSSAECYAALLKIIFHIANWNKFSLLKFDHN